MKKSLLAVSCLFTTVWALASPAPRWVPANADLVMVADNSAPKDPAIEAAWEKAFADAGLSPNANVVSLDQLATYSPKLPALFRALGYTEDGKNDPITAAVFSATLPKTRESLQAEGFPKDLAFHLHLQNAKLDIKALDKAVAELCDEKDDDGKAYATYKKDGTWRILSPTVDADEQREVPGFIGYRPVKGGLLMTICASQADAEAWATGKTPGIDKTSPLATAFPATDKPEETSRLRIADLAAVIKRLSTEETLKEQALRAPMLPKTHTVGLDITRKGMNCVMTLSAVMADADSAIQLRDFLLGWKGMLTQLFLPMFTQKPDSALAALVNTMACEAREKTTTLRLEVSPEMAAKVVKEAQALQASAMNADELEDDPELDDTVELDLP